MTEQLLEPLPDVEMIGYRLDLGRSELEGVMNRYRSEKHRAAQVQFNPPRALIVTRFEGEEGPLRAEFEKNGWLVDLCAGPGNGGCPLLRGEQCEQRELADAAVVYIDPRGDHSGNVARLRCAADSASPGVVAVEGQMHPATFTDHSATIGSWRGPKATLEAVTALLATQDRS
jgi:hypothetical protein